MKLIKIDWIERDVDFVIQLDDISLEDIKTKEFKTFVKDILIKQMYYRDKDIDITGLCLSEVDKNNVREDDIWIGVWKKEDGEFSTCVVLDYPNTQSSLYMDKALFGETWGFTQVYLSCPVEITKELYRKGDTEKLSSYYLGDSTRHNNPNPTLVNAIYDLGRFRNANIGIRSREHNQKKIGWSEKGYHSLVVAKEVA